MKWKRVEKVTEVTEKWGGGKCKSAKLQEIDLQICTFAFCFVLLRVLEAEDFCVYNRSFNVQISPSLSPKRAIPTPFFSSANDTEISLVRKISEENDCKIKLAPS